MNELLQTNKPSAGGSVECLGMTFPSEDARREHFLNLLAEKLKEPNFRNQEGFPQGTDEAILALSDPPYYTPCPNPFLYMFVNQSDQASAQDSTYEREPYATDVSEGKQQAIYNAHSYHTKVPHKAIMRYILHYTKPGDLVLDAFCGTGMTGLAAHLCGNQKAVMELGYRVTSSGEVLESDTDENGQTKWKKVSEIGPRRVLLNDLSPAATFISYNYNHPFDVPEFERKSNEIIDELWDQIGWMYQTKHENGELGRINFTIWSDIFVCRECGGEINFWISAIDKEKAEVRDKFPCPHCGAEVTKRNLDRAWTIGYDQEVGENTRQKKQVPVRINYSIPGSSKRYEKYPDQDDFDRLRKIDDLNIGHWFPTDTLPTGDKTGEPKSVGINRVHHFYTKRNLLALATAFEKMHNSPLRFLFTAFISGASKLNQLHLKNYIFGGGGANPGPRKGVIYSPSISLESAVPKLMEERLKTQLRGFNSLQHSGRRDFIISTGSASSFGNSEALENVLDYVFIDPPFGSNLMYSELSHTWESWLKVHTNNEMEAIENKSQSKNVDAYRGIMEVCFQNIFRLLKPGRWMTVEFSNTQAHVWNNIQSAINSAGFIIGNVSALDKKQGGMNAIVGTTAVKQDLVISAYKPSDSIRCALEERPQNVDNVWQFIDTHLRFVPTVKMEHRNLKFVPERDPRILFDRMVSYFVKNQSAVPISSQDFRDELIRRYSERDGMIFLPDQVAEYDRKRAQAAQAPQMELFVSDERSAIDWLTNFLRKRPSTYQEVHPEFTTQVGAGWKKHEEKPELSALLEDNFLRFDGNGDVPSQIHSYLSTNFKDLRGLEKEDPRLKAKAKDRWYVPDPNKAKDLEQKRERSLLKEFEAYKTANKRQLKESRLEVLRTGFKTAWAARDYKTIIGIAQKIPEEALQEDEKLLLWYDQALTRMEADA